MDRRTQGRSERRFLHADAACLRVLRALTSGLTLSSRGIRLLLWPHVQTDAGNIAICAFASRLLASR